MIFVEIADNVAFATQIGDRNSIKETQLGNKNLATDFQDGCDNDIIVKQVGNLHDHVGIQVGNNNSQDIFQESGNANGGTCCDAPTLPDPKCPPHSGGGC